MKKLLFAVLIAALLGTTAFAASPVKLYTVTETTFRTDFKNATDVSWTAGTGYAKATFVLNSIKMEAFYNLSGELIGTSRGITLDQLPVKAKRNFAGKFGDYVVKEAIRFEGPEEAAYFISAENEKEFVIVKITDTNSISITKQTKK